MGGTEKQRAIQERTKKRDDLYVSLTPVLILQHMKFEESNVRKDDITWLTCEC